MFPDDDAAYLALKARDARFDGRLFVGVTSTGIYCRPVCRVRTPRRENCRFFGSAAQAEAQAFRPCLKCRPEIAPGLSAMDSSDALAHTAARWLQHAVHAGEPLALPALAARLGVTDRHLRRIFQATHGVTPRDFIATQRLLLAKQLLTDTAAPVTQVALASGFESLRRFNAAFAERYRLSPSRLRREGPGPAVGTPLRLAWRPPYDIEAMLAFHARRAMAGIEQVVGLVLRRTIALPTGSGALAGWIECRFVPERHELHLVAAPALGPALGALLQRVRLAFDLDADPAQIDPVLARLPVPPRPGLRLPGCFDGFELALRVVLGQQVTVKAARTLVQRMVQQYGRTIETPFEGLDRLFPDAATIAQADPEALGRLGIVRQRVRALQALACEVAAGRLPLYRGAPLESTLDALRALPGIGDWTAQLIAMRALAWPDAFPATDIGLLNALGTRDVAATTRAAEAWRPWRAYAVIRLWHSLENPP
jgi:AraC family transcriptional regulator of adaptative response / DNA-3-methyladenine glycosylase II